MKKLVALLTSAVMALGLSTAVFATSITGPVSNVTASTASGEALKASSVADLTTEVLDKVVKNPEVRSIVDTLVAGKAEEAYELLVDLAGEDLTLEDGTPVDLNNYAPVDTLALVNTDSVAVDPVTEEIEVTSDFVLSEGKAIEDYLEVTINPASGDVAVVKPEMDEVTNKFSYKLGFYPAFVQTVEAK